MRKTRDFLCEIIEYLGARFCAPFLLVEIKIQAGDTRSMAEFPVTFPHSTCYAGSAEAQTCSPHTRGWTVVDLIAMMRIVLFPAHAGLGSAPL